MSLLTPERLAHYAHWYDVRIRHDGDTKQVLWAAKQEAYKTYIDCYGLDDVADADRAAEDVVRAVVNMAAGYRETGEDRQ